MSIRWRTMQPRDVRACAGAGSLQRHPIGGRGVSKTFGIALDLADFV